MRGAHRFSRDAGFAAAAWCGLSATAWPHAFDDRYDLPAPLSYFVTGATAAVGLSFVVAAAMARRAPPAASEPACTLALGPLLPALRFVGRVVSLLLFALVVIAGLIGTRDPMMNLAPTTVWIIWWVGLTQLVACVGNIWPAIDPWGTLFGMMDTLARRLGFKKGIALGWTYPQSVGAWPAVALLLAWCWFEVVYAQGTVPHRIAFVAIGWSAVTLGGMVCFGRESWQQNADVFAIYFATIGRFAPAARGPDGRSIIVRAPGRGLITADSGSIAMAGFVIAMLSTVLFDGLLGGETWPFVQQKITRLLPWLFDSSGYIVGTIGLAGVWLVFFGLYGLSCKVTAVLAGKRPAAAIVRAFALTLVPIAIAYNIAHYFSALLVQGQHLIPLLSDPFGFQWNLIGTATYTPDIGIIDARVTWYLAIGAIVTGHVIAIWLAHRIALREFGTPRKAVIASVPLTMLMLLYTAISLSVIAEPMVKFDMPAQSSGLWLTR
jgi:hypothetical protein